MSGLDRVMRKIESGGTSIVASDGHGAPTGGYGPVERSFLIRPELPCGTCDHAAVCSIKPKLEAASIEYRTPPSPDPAVKIVASLSIVCQHYQLRPMSTAAIAALPPLTSSQRGAAASKAQRAAGTAGSSVGSLSTVAPKKRELSEAGAKLSAAWSPERRAAQSERIRNLQRRQEVRSAAWSPERRAAQSERIRNLNAAKKSAG